MRQNVYKSKRNMTVMLSLFFVVVCVMLVTSITKALDIPTSGYCGADADGKNVQWSYDTDNNVLTFRGTGAIADYGSGEREWDVYYKKAKKIVVEEGITRVGSNVCENYSNVTELLLPSTLKSIGQTFNGMTNLQELVLPTGLQEIGENSFSEMNSLRELILPVDLQEIGDYSFTGLYNIRKIDVPGIQTINAGLFTGMGTCAVRLNEGTETVQNGAISISYSTIYMPSTLTTWNDGFKSARYIYGKNDIQESFAYKEDITYIDATQSYNIEGAKIEIDGDLYTVQDKNVYLSYKHEGTDVPLNEGFDYTVEFSVDPVSGGATAIFSGIGCYTGTKTVKLGKYAGYCGAEKFKDAMWMFENGTLTITGIGGINTGLYGNSDSILNKDDITKIVIEEGIESIGVCSFYGCNNLESVEFPSSLKNIKTNAFVDCSSLTEIELPEGLEEMEYGAFEGCSSLASVKIPSSLKVLEDCIFQGCYSLEEVEVPEGITVIKGAFPDCKGLKKVILPDGITEIGGSAFGGCESLEMINIPTSVKNIGGNAFYNDAKLKEFELPNGLETIGDYAFVNVKAFKDITFDASLKLIGQQAFRGCSKITSVIFEDSPVEIGQEAFYDCERLTRVDFGRNVKKIGNSAFSGCRNLKNIELSSSIAEIESGAFSNCSAIESLIIGTRQIDQGAFTGCIGLNNLEFEDTVVCIGDYAFMGIGTLQKMILPQSLTTLGDYAFKDTSIKRVEFPDTLINIGDDVFNADLVDLIVCANEIQVEYCKSNGYNYLDATEDVNKASIKDCDITLEYDRIAYDGTPKTPSVTVKYNGENLTKDTDYTIDYNNNIEVGAAEAIVTGIDKYEGSEHLSFSIYEEGVEEKTTSIDKCSFQLEYDRIAYDGTPKTPSVTVKYKNETLIKDKDYTVSYSSNKAVGTATVTITGIGSYDNTKDVTFTIYEEEEVAKVSIKDCDITLEYDKIAYDGTAKKPTVTVKHNNKTLIKDTDYIIAYSNNTAVGTATVTITGIGSYENTKDVTFTIYEEEEVNKTSIKDCDVTLEYDRVAYDGTAKEPIVTVKYNNKTLTKDTDYTVTYSNNTVVGIASVTVTGIGAYDDDKDVTFVIYKEEEISKTAINDCTISLEFDRIEYNGAAKTPTATVKYNGRTLIKDTDYTVTYSNNTAVGTATVTVSGINNYYGQKKIQFLIYDDSSHGSSVNQDESHSNPNEKEVSIVDNTGDVSNPKNETQTQNSTSSNVESSNVEVHRETLSNVTAKAGDNKSLTLNVYNDNAKWVDIRSSNNKIIEPWLADNSGDNKTTKCGLTCKKIGTADINLSFYTEKGGILLSEYKFTVTVKKGKTKISAKRKYTLEKGDKLDLSSTIIGDGKVTYKSNKKSVASVTSKGKVTCKKRGTAVITIKVKGTTSYSAATKKIKIVVKKATGNTKVNVSTKQQVKKQISKLKKEIKKLKKQKKKYDKINKKATKGKTFVYGEVVSYNPYIVRSVGFNKTVTYYEISNSKNMISSLSTVAGWVETSGKYSNWYDKYGIERKCVVCKAVKVNNNDKSMKIAKKIAEKEKLLEEYQAALKQKVAFTVTECNLDLSSDTIDLYDISYFEYDDKYNDIQWSSSNPNVATISSDWIVQPKSIGTTIITAKATFSGKKSSIVVNVVDMTSFSLYTETECWDGKTINYEFSDVHNLNDYMIYPVYSYKDGREKYPISYKVEGDTINVEKTEVGNYRITINNKIGVSKVTFYNKACSKEIIFNVTGNFPFSLGDYKDTVDLINGQVTKIEAVISYRNENEPVKYEIDGNSVSVTKEDMKDYSYSQEITYQIKGISPGTSKVRFYNSTTSYTVVFNVKELFESPEKMSGVSCYMGRENNYLWIHIDSSPSDDEVGYWEYREIGDLGKIIMSGDGNYLLCGEYSTYYLISKRDDGKMIVELWDESRKELLETMTMIEHISDDGVHLDFDVNSGSCHLVNTVW